MKNVLPIKNKIINHKSLLINFKSPKRYKTILFYIIPYLLWSNISYCQSSDTIVIEIVGKPVLEKTKYGYSDTLTIQFNLYKNKERRLFLDERKDFEINASETKRPGKRPIPLGYKEGSLKKLKRAGTGGEDIPSDITISLLVDRSGSILEPDMAKIRAAVKEFVEKVPDSCLFFSWFHDDISTSRLLTSENFNEIQFKASDKNTALYNAIYTKILEFDKDSVFPNLKYEEGLEKTRKFQNEIR